MSNEKSKTAFISGHLDLSQEEFNQYYKSKIDKAIQQNHSFVIGDAKGADSMTQKYLINLVPKNQVKVYHMYNKPLNNKGKYVTVGGFKSHNKKDSAMTKNSDYDIAYVRSPRTTKIIRGKRNYL